MGKRELLIALAFVAVGLVAYQLTAPAGSRTSRGPLGGLVDEVRREIRGNPGRASHTHREVISVPRDVTELRLPPATSLTLTGEARHDVAYELTVEAVGPDDGAALAAAREVTLRSDTIGNVLALLPVRRVARATSALTVRVPARLAIRIEGVRRAHIGDVASVHLEGLVGDARLTNVAGAITGSHRNGTLAIDGAETVELTLTGSRATLQGVGRAVQLTARGGEIQIHAPRGEVDLSTTDVEVTIVRPHGRVRLTGTNGQAVVDRPMAETTIDGRRLDVAITLATAVPVTAMTAERPLQLLLDGAVAITIDAATSDGGAIDGTAFDLTPEKSERGERLLHRFGDAAPVALRNQRAAIVIGRSK